jgi:hypothetical protein
MWRLMMISNDKNFCTSLLEAARFPVCKIVRQAWGKRRPAVKQHLARDDNISAEGRFLLLLLLVESRARRTRLSARILIENRCALWDQKGNLKRLYSEKGHDFKS